jgi:hypothetical protein
VSDEETKRLQNAVHSFSLLRVSNTLPTFGGNREKARKLLEKSLGFHITKGGG